MPIRELEKWKLTICCHLRPSDAMPLPTLNLLRAPGHQRLNFDGFIYIHYAVPPYSAGIIIIVSVYGGWVKILILLFRHLAFVELKTVQNKHILTSRFFKQGNPSNFSRAFTNLSHYSTCRIGWVMLSDIPLRSMAMKQQTTFTEGA